MSLPPTPPPDTRFDWKAARQISLVMAVIAAGCFASYFPMHFVDYELQPVEQVAGVLVATPGTHKGITRYGLAVRTAAGAIHLDCNSHHPSNCFPEIQTFDGQEVKVTLIPRLGGKKVVASIAHETGAVIASSSLFASQSQRLFIAYSVVSGLLLAIGAALFALAQHKLKDLPRAQV